MPTNAISLVVLIMVTRYVEFLLLYSIRGSILCTIKQMGKGHNRS